MRLEEIGEFGLIARLREREAKPREGVVIGIGDDAAALESPKDAFLLLTTDTLVEDVHFRRGWMPWADLGWKSVVQNVSDIAAMGGEPSFGLVTLALPDDVQVEDIDAIYEGIDKASTEYGCAVTGGDVVRSPGPMSITISLLGRVARDRLMRRSGAQPGDLIVVTGGLGAAAAGLIALDRGLSGPPFALALAAQRRPHARLQEGKALAASGVVTALIDLSDGLAGDLAHICEESQVGARVDLASVPVAEACHTACEHLGVVDSLQLALTGGEDFELLFTVPPGSAGVAHRALTAAGGRAFPIGTITPAEAGIIGVTKEGTTEPLGTGFAHF
ncbi:hypothetical protein AMK68_02920 [candidate division KD3-62 bacterium DG_56]|uniref:Thiamine-monophosphate kinase n=1 Tax=candidate division KD3-62 bacterium DG_56 TaxID=1704032 RepID=A0A0S7XNM5_9BACT|nr:MAG: hypothetical protein AMK68_02920 [candidate division KD3-62 bacterium DG_56]